MTDWWHDPDAPWRSQLAADLFPGIEARTDERGAEYDAVVDEHRLAPWLHARRADKQIDWAVAAREAMARSLQQQNVLGTVLDVLAAQEIAPVLLKGLPLALFTYEEPWHRPMRDLDLLIDTHEQAIAAQHALMKEGFEGLEGTCGDASALLGERHQLPVLAAPDGVTFVELHVRLFHGDENEERFADAVEREALGRRVRVLTPEAQYLHLVGHAARDHRFDNGPQVIVDLAMLSRAELLNRGHLHELAQVSGLSRHLALLVKMMRDAFPDVALGGGSAADIDRAAALAWKLMTSPADDVASARDRRETRGSSRSRLLSRVFPSPARLASAQGSARSAGTVLGQYARHYARLATERLPRMLDSNPSDSELVELIDWLEA